jgi:hypothetical protein
METWKNCRFYLSLRDGLDKAKKPFMLPYLLFKSLGLQMKNSAQQVIMQMKLIKGKSANKRFRK